MKLFLTILITSYLTLMFMVWFNKGEFITYLKGEDLKEENIHMNKTINISEDMYINIRKFILNQLPNIINNSKNNIDPLIVKNFEKIYNELLTNPVTENIYTSKFIELGIDKDIAQKIAEYIDTRTTFDHIMRIVNVLKSINRKSDIIYITNNNKICIVYNGNCYDRLVFYISKDSKDDKFYYHQSNINLNNNIDFSNEELNIHWEAKEINDTISSYLE